jgi:hypothetical protein
MANDDNIPRLLLVWGDRCAAQFHKTLFPMVREETTKKQIPS